MAKAGTQKETKLKKKIEEKYKRRIKQKTKKEEKKKESAEALGSDGAEGLKLWGGVNELVRSVSLWEAITVSFGRDHKDTIYVLFYTLRQKKTGFRVLSKLCCFIKHFSFFLFLERRARRGEEEEGI